MESKAFQAGRADFEAKGAVIVGCSPDGEKAQCKFRQKYGLEFPLLCDTDHSVANAYGVWGEKKFMGRRYMGVTRATFLIDEEGVITHAWANVKVQGHDAEVLAAL